MERHTGPFAAFVMVAAGETAKGVCMAGWMACLGDSFRMMEITYYLVGLQHEKKESVPEIVSFVVVRFENSSCAVPSFFAEKMAGKHLDAIAFKMSFSSMVKQSIYL